MTIIPLLSLLTEEDEEEEEELDEENEAPCPAPVGKRASTTFPVPAPVPASPPRLRIVAVMGRRRDRRAPPAVPASPLDVEEGTAFMSEKLEGLAASAAADPEPVTSSTLRPRPCICDPVKTWAGIDPAAVRSTRVDEVAALEDNAVVVGVEKEDLDVGSAVWGRR